MTAAESGLSNLQLVRQALDEYESLALSGSLRRAQRIATRLAEERDALRFSIELRGIGGDLTANAIDIRRMVDGDGTKLHSEVIEMFIGDRRDSKAGDVLSMGVLDMEYWIARPEPVAGTISRETAAQLQQQKYMVIGALGAISGRVYTALCGWEKQLTFRERNEHLLTGHRERLDGLLKDQAPAVLERFNAVYDRFEAPGLRGDDEAAEVLSQAVTSCRRILKAVVDHVMPADPTVRTSSDGHPLNESAYKNRLFEYLKTTSDSDSFAGALAASSEALWRRFDAADIQGSKGVHADVVRREAEFCALNTWLIAGEILALQDAPSP